MDKNSAISRSALQPAFPHQSLPILSPPWNCPCFGVRKIARNNTLVSCLQWMKKVWRGLLLESRHLNGTELARDQGNCLLLHYYWLAVVWIDFGLHRRSECGQRGRKSTKSRADLLRQDLVFGGNRPCARSKTLAMTMNISVMILFWLAFKVTRSNSPTGMRYMISSFLQRLFCCPTFWPLQLFFLAEAAINNNVRVMHQSWLDDRNKISGFAFHQWNWGMTKLGILPRANCCTYAV